MPINEAMALLRWYNEWRRGADVAMPEPRTVCDAIDTVLSECERLRDMVAELKADIERRAEDCALNYNTILELRKIISEQEVAIANREAAPVKESLTTAHAVALPDLWSFLRDVLRQGAAIESQQGQQGYETFIAYIEAEAHRQAKKLRAMIPAAKPELLAGYVMLSQSMPPEFELWLSKEMPPLTTIGNASWWAPKIWRAALRTGAVPLAASQQAREEGK